MINLYVKQLSSPIPAFKTPITRVLVDIVRLLPKSKAGNNNYLWPIMDTSTRFPEAILLWTIATNNASVLTGLDSRSRI